MSLKFVTGVQSSGQSNDLRRAALGERERGLQKFTPPSCVSRSASAAGCFSFSIKQKFGFILLLQTKRKCVFILSMSQSEPERWTELLSDEDRVFLKRFILTSGSLKELAAAYSVTYPTVRLRLDRLIEKIKVFDKKNTADDYERLLRGLYAEGRFDAATFHQLLKHYQQE
jgi:hypothetical protein